jgi:hypothetical protein
VYDEEVEHPSEGRRRRDFYDDDRGREPVARRHRREYYYDDDVDNADRGRRGSKVDNALMALQDGDLRGAVTAMKPRSMSMGRSQPARSRSYHRRRGSSADSYERPSRGRSVATRHRSSDARWEQAISAALTAGVVEAYRVRNQPGRWAGGKGARVATAAIGAAAVDGTIDRDTDRRSKMHVVEAVLGGLAVNRIANGPRHRR